MIPVLVAAGHRVVAPDLIGFGRSDKPVGREDYTYQRHVDWMRGLVLGLDLRDATLVGQDWGGLIGLRLATDHPERFARLVAANTFLPTGDRPPVTRGADRLLQESIPGARGQPHTTIVGGGHFLQEDRGEELARVIVDFIRQTAG